MSQGQRTIARDDFLSLAQATLAAGASLQFRARGYSMQPHIFDGDLLLLQAVQIQSLRIGDVVLAQQRDGQACVHRLAEIQENRILLRADTAPLESWFDFKDVVGRVSLVRRNNCCKYMEFLIKNIFSGIIRFRRQKPSQ